MLEYKRGQRSQRNEKCLTGKSSISFTLFVRSSQSRRKYFPLHFKDFLKL